MLRSICIVLLPLVCLALGCAPAAAPPAATARGSNSHEHDHGHDGHDHGDEDYDSPTTIAAGIAALEKICGEVKAELAEGDLDDADGKVHMVGHLLDDLRVLVMDAKPAADVETAAKKALDGIFDCFDKMDTALHSADEAERKSLDYAAHAATIEAAITSLKALFP
ncbi:MAG: hypothetical protein ACK52C_06185 [Planctomycetia bacterium]